MYWMGAMALMGLMGAMDRMSHRATRYRADKETSGP